MKLANRRTLARVADPVRQPKRILDAIFSPVGTWVDKIRLIPLINHVKFNSIEDLFEEEEVDTLTCLQRKYKFSDKMIKEFFTPFFEGIYLCSLDNQSSRMFHFVFKMFSDGAATLPTGGMQAVSDQLVEKAKKLDVDVRMNTAVDSISLNSNSYTVSSSPSSSSSSPTTTLTAKKVICATEYLAARRLLSKIQGLEMIIEEESQSQKSAACIYYCFKGNAPVVDPLLILNGEGTGPINNVSFPSNVNNSYSPPGYSLCSVALANNAMAIYRNKEDELDKAVRAQLATWFEEYSEDILSKWVRKGQVYEIKNAQPNQIGGAFPANVNEGRVCTKFGNTDLPPGLFVCGDHMVSGLHIWMLFFYVHRIFHRCINSFCKT